MKKYILVLLSAVLLQSIASAQTTLTGGIATTPTGTDLNLRTFTGTANRLTIVNAAGTNQGYIGINAASAAAIVERLHIFGNVRTSGNVISDGGVFNTASTTNPLIFQTNGVERMRIVNSGTTAGFVGIGATVPQINLEVAGTANGDKIGQVIRNMSATGYATIRLYNNLNSNVRALEMDYSGSTYAGALVPGGPTGESASLATTGAFPLVLGTSNTARMTITSAGNIGIGTASPETKLHVNGGTMTLDVGDPKIFLASGSSNMGRYLSILNSPSVQSSSGLKVGGVLVSDTYGYANPGSNDLIVKGKVGIGTPFTNNPNSYALAVNGKIGTKDVQIEAGSTTWSDYVFEPTYKLISLTDLEKFIIENKHLPEIPSAQEVEKDGYSMNDLDVTLLKKVEELTLYIIEQQKQINALRAELEKNKK